MSAYTQQRFIFMTLDPVHIGAGGYRLGRVDMSIIREPGTNLPKIPGTSLAGAARSYAHLSLFGTAEDRSKKKNGPGGDKDNAFYYTFGSATDTGGGQAGTVSIGDARLLFFPVASQCGPVWVTTAEILKEVWGQNIEMEAPANDEQVITSLKEGHLNLGWLLLKVEKKLADNFGPNDPLENWDAIKSRIAVVSTKLMTQIVNSNLEVRTSVSIDPETGAADDGALFTYEALPRATWLWCDIIEDNYRNNFKALNDKPEIERPLDVVKAGLELIEYLGVGGMGTRGFGRMKIAGIIENKETQQKAEVAEVAEVAHE